MWPRADLSCGVVFGLLPVESSSLNREQPGAADAIPTPLVSVCLPVRNGAERLANVIESVLAQTHENLELVVCDNASTDATENVCRELAASDPRILYHRHPANIGLLNNFISAMRMSRGASSAGSAMTTGCRRTRSPAASTRC